MNSNYRKVRGEFAIMLASLFLSPFYCFCGLCERSADLLSVDHNTGSVTISSFEKEDTGRKGFVPTPLPLVPFIEARVSGSEIRRAIVPGLTITVIDFVWPVTVCEEKYHPTHHEVAMFPCKGDADLNIFVLLSGDTVGHSARDQAEETRAANNEVVFYVATFGSGNGTGFAHSNTVNRYKT